MSGLSFCMITTFYPPHNFGGDGIGIQRLCHGLVRRGHRVDVVHDVDAFHSLHEGPDPIAPPEPDGMTIHRLTSGRGILSPLLTQQIGRPIVNGGRIREILEQGDYDVINFHNISLVGGPGILEYGDALKLYMAHEHWLVCPTHVLWRHNRELCDGRECLRCSLSYRRPPQLWRYTGYLKRELRHVDAFIAMSRFSREKHREFGFPREMEVVPYFLPDEEPEDGRPAPHDRPYFLFVGRLEKIKGLSDVIPAFAKIGGADLLVAGDGTYAETLKKEAEGIDAVRFLGRVPLEELAGYYRHALALIVPSVCYETFGIILIESFRHGTPVIARRIGPFPEIVEESGGGELFSTGEELAAAIERILGDEERRRRLGQAGYDAWRRLWSESAVVPRYLEVVRDVADRRGDRRVLEKLEETA